ncbi:hypothetical protein HDU79_009865 [Rhizoclosmatium sp. JEL0117]|nr:hypothetical protein HDU79_009865 [Rhizoclosmatium sp. JEL0117]
MSSQSFTNVKIQYFGTGTASDPSPANGNGACHMVATDKNYFAAVTQDFYKANPNVCNNMCAIVSCAKGQCGGRAVAVQIIDSFPSTASSGPLSISLPAMGALLGSTDLAVNSGVINFASYTVAPCPDTLGVVTNPSSISGGGISTSSVTTSTSSGNSEGTSSTSTLSSTVTSGLAMISLGTTIQSSTSSSSDSNLGPILGGVAAATFLLIVVAFVLWLKARTARQQREDQQMQIINRYGGGSGSAGHPTLRRDTSTPIMDVPAPAGFLPAQAMDVPVVPVSPQQQFYPQHQPQQAYGFVQPQQLQPQLQPQQADYSAEWAEYFRQNPEEYKKYYGTTMPRQ